MAQDIRDIFKNDKKLETHKMPQGHEHRFLLKLESSATNSPKGFINPLVKIAASIVIIIGLGYGGFTFFNKTNENSLNVPKNAKDVANLKTLGDVSPALRKVEDYYMANINLELSNMDVNDENRDLFNGYINKLEELNKEYKRLSVELTESGPNELTINALIDNLKFRLNLMYRLKEQLIELGETNSIQNKLNI